MQTFKEAKLEHMNEAGTATQTFMAEKSISKD
jgi:hypothetical protein